MSTDNCKSNRFPEGRAKILFADESSLDSIWQIEQRCFVSAWSRDALRHELLTLGWSRILIAEVDDQIVGYLCFWTVADEYQLLKVGVLPEYRGRRIGQQLIDALIWLGRQEKAHLISLELRTSNRAALLLYEKCQFTVIGVRKGYYTDTNEDAILMDYAFPSG